MDCTHAQNLMSAVIDGPASADERAALEEHVAHCAACSDEFAAAKEIDGDLRRLFAPRREAAARLAERVAQQLAASRLTASNWLMARSHGGRLPDCGVGLSAVEAASSTRHGTERCCQTT